MRGGGEDGAGGGGQVEVEGCEVSGEAGVVLQAAGGPGQRVAVLVLQHVHAPPPRGRGVQRVDVHGDVHALVSHVQEHVLPGVDAADNRRTEDIFVKNQKRLKTTKKFETQNKLNEV